MDTKQLNEDLSKIFVEEDEQIVFWNDLQQEFDKVIVDNGQQQLSVE